MVLGDTLGPVKLGLVMRLGARLVQLLERLGGTFEKFLEVTRVRETLFCFAILEPQVLVEPREVVKPRNIIDPLLDTLINYSIPYSIPNSIHY